MSMGGEFSSKPVLFCCHDAIAAMLDEHQGELSGQYFLPHTLGGNLSFLQDKREMEVMAAECSISIPPKDGFPMIVKPANSVFGSKDDIQICANNEELDEYFRSHNRESTLAQHFVDKQSEFQLIGCVTCDGEVIIPGRSEILRPCKGSNTSFLRYQEIEDGFCDVEKCKRLMEKTGFRGLFSMEFLKDAEGRNNFIEVNFRNDGNAICVTAAGINLPYIWYLSCIGASYREEVRKPETLHVIPEFEETALLTSGQISFVTFLSDILKSNCGMDFDIRDPKPFFSKLRHRIRNKTAK